jgi:hypothetical protein
MVGIFIESNLFSRCDRLTNSSTLDTTTATAALEKGLQDLEDLCDVVSEEFWTQRENFMAAKK